MLKTFCFILGAISTLLTPLAGPYRAVAYKVDAFGGIGYGVLTWAGVAALYPAYFYLWDVPEMRSGFLWSWATLALTAWIAMLARWCSVRPRLDPGDGHCRLGRWEPILALAIAAAAHSAGDTGGFVLAGYACSTTQILLVRLGRRFEAWTHEDTWRLRRPFVTAAKLVYDFSWMFAVQGTMSVAVATPIALAGIRRALSLFLSAGRWAVGVQPQRPSPAMPMPYPHHSLEGAAYQPIYLPAYPNQQPEKPLPRRLLHGYLFHIALGLLTGSPLLVIILLPIALALKIAGFPVGVPHIVKEKMHAVWSFFEDKKDDLGERIEEQRERISGGFNRKKDELRDGAEEAKDRLVEKGEELEREAGRRARKSVIGF